MENVLKHADETLKRRAHAVARRGNSHQPEGNFGEDGNGDNEEQDGADSGGESGAQHSLFNYYFNQ